MSRPTPPVSQERKVYAQLRYIKLKAGSAERQRRIYAKAARRKAAKRET